MIDILTVFLEDNDQVKVRLFRNLSCIFSYLSDFALKAIFQLILTQYKIDFSNFSWEVEYEKAKLIQILADFYPISKLIQVLPKFEVLVKSPHSKVRDEAAKNLGILTQKVLNEGNPMHMAACASILLRLKDSQTYKDRLTFLLACE